MGLRNFLKRILGKTDSAIDVVGDRFDEVSSTVKKTGTLIADDASDFAKKTFSNLKDAGGELKNQTKEATQDFKERTKKDYNDIKNVAEKQMHDTSGYIKEKVADVKEALKDEKTDLEVKSAEIKEKAENELDDISSTLNKEEN